MVALSLLGVGLPACNLNQPQEPEPETQVQGAVTSTSTVLVNQVGYLTGASKIGVGVGACAGAAFTVKNAAGTVVFSGTTSASVSDPGSGDTVCKADFSAFVTAGTGYKLNITGLGDSDAFNIGTTDPYGNLYKDAMNYFVFHRAGTAPVSLTVNTAKGGTFARSWALRPTTALTAYNGWTAGTFNIDGGHADAGDFGLYPDNTVQGMFFLMNIKELKNPDSAVFDLAGEIDYGVKYLRNVLPADATKQATHKCHDDSWGTQNWGGYPAGNDASASVRHCMGPSITATYSMARALAQAARVVSTSANAASFWTGAQAAWTRANGALTPIYAGPSPGAAIGGGDYQDNNAADDKFDAAVEMYLTAKSKAVAYTSYLPLITGDAANYKKITRTLDWGEASEYTQGNLSLWAYNKTHAAALATEIDITGIETAIKAEADAVLADITANGYPSAIHGTSYTWGSNKIVMASAIILAYAREITGDVTYTRAMHRAMDYVMGVNTLRLSMITGYGTNFEKATHDRQANGNSPVGWLAGGPLDASLVNDSLTPKGAFSAKNYYLSDTGWDNAWCSKENTIDWNGPLAWVAWYLRASASDLTTVTPPTIPAAPTGLIATSGNAQVALSWSASSGATSYNVLRSTTSGSGYTSVVTGVTATSYTNTALTNGTAYYFVVQAANTAGTSGNSAQASATPAATGTIPAAPTGLTATAGNAQVVLSWTASSGATSYKVLRSTTSGSGYASVATGVTPTTYTNTGLTNGTTYYFVVQATNATGTSGNSAQASAIPASTVTIPAAPTGLTATAGNAQVVLSWTASSGATSYKVLRSTTSGSGYTSVATGVAATTYTNTALTNGTAYYFVVQATNTAGTSGNSAQAAATPSAGGGSIPSNCTSPVTVAAGATTLSINKTGGGCWKVTLTANGGNMGGWGCSNFTGRTMSVDGSSASGTCGFAVTKWTDGSYYFVATAGTLSYAAFNWW